MNPTLSIISNIVTLIDHMRQRKKQKGLQSKGQLTLNDMTMKSQSMEHDPNVIRYQIEKEAQKLLKVRKQIQQKKRQEERIVNKLMRLQIGVDSLIENKKDMTMQEEDEQYWMMTSPEYLNQGTTSLLKLVLEDYGSVVTNKCTQKTKNIEAAEQEVTAQEVTQWRQKGIINNQYLTDYGSTFIHSLREYQYVADDLQQSLK